jgi:hypothetical protein
VSSGRVSSLSGILPFLNAEAALGLHLIACHLLYLSRYIIE